MTTARPLPNPSLDSISYIVETLEYQQKMFVHLTWRGSKLNPENYYHAQDHCALKQKQTIKITPDQF